MKNLPAVIAIALFYVSSTVFAASPWLDGFNEIRIDEASEKKVGDTFLQTVEFIMEAAQIDGLPIKTKEFCVLRSSQIPEVMFTS